MALTKIKLGKDLLQAYFWYTKTYEGLKLARTKITILKLLKDLFSSQLTAPLLMKYSMNSSQIYFVSIAALLPHSEFSSCSISPDGGQ